MCVCVGSGSGECVPAEKERTHTYAFNAVTLASICAVPLTFAPVCRSVSLAEWDYLKMWVYLHVNFFFFFL